MFELNPTLIGLIGAAGIGLLIGIERERNKGEGADREVAGVRTFTLTALTGAVSWELGTESIFAAIAVMLGLLVVVGYQRTRQHDPGLTTEIALLIVFVLGAWSMQQPELAVGVGVVVAILLASRTPLHHWTRDRLTDQELHDGLLLAAAALVILPLTSPEAVDPWGVIKPRKLWTLAVLIMAINAAGYIALRVFGARAGLALAGLLSGFVSSTATIGSMGTRARQDPGLRRSAVAGAALSSVATVIQLALVVGVTSLTLLRALALPLAAAGIAAVIYGGVFTWHSVAKPSDEDAPRGRPFELKTALIFTATIGVALVASALLTQWLGNRGLILASALTGFADAHAGAISAASVAASGTADIAFASLAVLAAFSTNTVSKIVVSLVMGDRPYAWRIIPGLLLMTALAWLAMLGQTAVRSGG